MLLKSWFVRKPSEPMLKLMTCSHIAFMHNADKQMCARGTQSWFDMRTTCMHSQHSHSRVMFFLDHASNQLYKHYKQLAKRTMLMCQ